MNLKIGIFMIGLSTLIACSSGGNKGGYCSPDAGADVQCTPPTSSGPTPVIGPCTKGGWCLQWKPVRGKYPFSIHGTDSNNVWAVGTRGLVLKWNGSTWEQPSLPGIDINLVDVWASGPNNAWILSSNYTNEKNESVNSIFQWNGQDWIQHTIKSNGYLSAIGGIDENNVWVVGYKGTIINWNGEKWIEQKSGTENYLYDIQNAGAGSIWAVGESGTILKWNGEKWLRLSTSTSKTFSKVWNFGVKIAWAIGDSIVSNWDGHDWFAEPKHNTALQGRCISIGGSSPSNIWALCNYSEKDKNGKELIGGSTFLYDGTTWNFQEFLTINAGEKLIENDALFNSTHGLSDIWVADANHAWIVSEAGILFKGQ